MTIFRTCTGCKVHPGPCEALDAFKAKISGFGITSVKWRCASRVPRFRPGDAVWVLTVADRQGEHDDLGQPSRDYFPGVVLDQPGSKVLLHIKDGAAGRDDDSLRFVAGSNGFCMIPLSRIELRDAPRERVCFYCSQPESLGHPDGYYCAPPAEGRKWVGGEKET